MAASILLATLTNVRHPEMPFAATLAMVYADMNFEAFSEMCGMPEKDREGMQNDFKHLIAHALFDNPEALVAIANKIGTEGLEEYIMTLSEKEDDGGKEGD